MNQLAISEICSIDRYQSERVDIFPSRASIDWFIRKHRQRLWESRAIIAPTGRKLISPQAFDSLVIEIGAEATTGRFR